MSATKASWCTRLHFRLDHKLTSVQVDELIALGILTLRLDNHGGFIVKKVRLPKRREKKFLAWDAARRLGP